MRQSGPGALSLLEVRGLEVHFPIKKGILLERTVGAVRAVDGVDLSVERGRTLGVVGESGCGKSTLGRAVLRLEPITAGSVVFDGQDLSALSGGGLRAMRRRMQMVFEDPLASLDPRQSVSSVLSEPLRTHGVKGSHDARIRELLDLVGLPASATAAASTPAARSVRPPAATTRCPSCASSTCRRPPWERMRRRRSPRRRARSDSAPGRRHGTSVRSSTQRKVGATFASSAPQVSRAGSEGCRS